MYVKLVGFFLPGNNQSLAFSIALSVILMSNHGKDAKKIKDLSTPQMYLITNCKYGFTTTLVSKVLLF